MIPATQAPSARQRSALGRRIGSVAFLSLLANVAVLIKNAVVAARFGAGGTADLLAYGEAALLLLPTIILLRECYGMFVSIYGRVLQTEGPARASLLSAAAVRIVLLFGMLLSTLTLLFPKTLFRLMAPGLSGPALEQGAWLLRWISPVLICQEVAEFTRTIHNAHHRYVIPGSVLFAGNLVQAAILVSLPESNAMNAWILALNAAAFLQAAVFVLTAPGIGAFEKGAREPGSSLLRPGPLWHPQFRTLRSVVAPVAIGVLLVQLAGVIERAVLSYLAAGSLATLAYSRKLLSPVMTFLATSVALPIYVQMARTRSEDFSERSATLARGVQLDLFLFVPITALIWVLAPEVVSLAFQRGLFARHDVLNTTPLLRIGVLTILPAALLLLLRDYLYTSRRTGPLVIGGAVQLATTGAANLLLARKYGVIWVPWGVVAGTWLSFLALFFVVHRRNPDARISGGTRDTAVLLAAGLLAAAAGWGVKSLFPPSGPWTSTLAVLLAAGLSGVLAYAAGAWSLGHPFARALASRIRRAD